MKRSQIYLTEKQREELKALAEETGLPYAEHVRRAIDLYLKRDNKVPPPASELVVIKDRDLIGLA